MAIFDISEVEEKIGYSFKDKDLLRQCFTHKSYANEHKCSDNDRLEFFGDSIIKYVESEYLYKNLKVDEGDLTEIRQSIENNVYFLKTVKKMGLDKYVLLGNGQKKTLTKSEKLFSNVYEALVAGIYLDGGIREAKKFITNTVIDEMLKKKKTKKKDEGNDYKSRFQEYVQKNKIGSISYETLSKTGPDHNPVFRVAAMLNSEYVAEGSGKSKQQAQAEAARNALNILKKQGR